MAVRLRYEIDTPRRLRDPASGAAIRQLLQIAQEEWEGARFSVHPRTCRCLGREGVASPVLLLG